MLENKVETAEGGDEGAGNTVHHHHGKEEHHERTALLTQMLENKVRQPKGVMRGLGMLYITTMAKRIKRAYLYYSPKCLRISRDSQRG